MQTVYLCDDPLSSREPERHEVDDIRAFLASRYDHFPDTGRIYHISIAQDWDAKHEVGDCTPRGDRAEVQAAQERLARLPGPFHVVIYPKNAELALWAFFPAAVSYYAAKAIISQFQSPQQAIARHDPMTSPNNQLSDRQNQARMNARIPDILGQVRSTFDLIGVPYRIYEANRMVEYAPMCVGRGDYLIEGVKDGTDLIDNIDGESVQFYGPNTSPFNANPSLSIPATDAKFSELPLVVRKSNTVNGQKLMRVDMVFRFGENNAPSVWAQPADSTGFCYFQLDNTSTRDFTQFYTDGEYICLENSGSDGFGGTYEIDHVTPTRIYVKNAASVNSDWTTKAPFHFGTGATLRGTDRNWVGPYYCDLDGATQLILNFSAPRGLYFIDQDDGTSDHPQRKVVVHLAVEVTPTDADGNVTGSASVYTADLTGSDILRAPLGITIRPNITGYCRVRARNNSVRLASDGNWHPWDDARFLAYEDFVQWIDLYAAKQASVLHFGDVTTCIAKTVATREATAVKDRKLSALVTRKIRRRGQGTVMADGFSLELLPTKRADDIFVHVCVDPLIGRRQMTEVDITQVYAEIAAVQTYFGHDHAIEFCATLDKENLSAEQTIDLVAGAIFCTAYRTGSIIRLAFEKQTPDSVLLLGHRNKVPGTEIRTVSFGPQDDHDGVEYKYIDPDDDASMSVYVPADRSAVNPKVIESVGVRNKLQAYLHANRSYNKIQYQRITAEAEVTQEADILVRTNRVLWADNTRPGTQDGEVKDVNGFVLTLSQKVVFAVGKTYTIFLQLMDGTIDAMSCTAGPGPKQVVLERAPRLALVVDDDRYAKALYWVVPDDDPREQAFIVTEKEPQARFTSIVRGVNYDDRYYAADADYKNGVVDSDGNPV